MTYVEDKNELVYRGQLISYIAGALAMNLKLICFSMIDFRRGPLLPEQVVVTPRTPSVRTSQAQLTEDNEDFASRGRYHQSEIVKGKNFDDDAYPSD